MVDNDVVKQADEGKETTMEEVDITPEAEKQVYLVCVPGSAFGTSVFRAESKQDAANQFAVATGLQPVLDEDGNDVVDVAVIELDAVKVDQAEVEKILNPKG